MHETHSLIKINVRVGDIIIIMTASRYFRKFLNYAICVMIYRLSNKLIRNSR